jgi:SAM-dependent methyltransferase
MSLPYNETDLSRIYAQRFAANPDYRKRVWRVLIDSFFQQYVPRGATVLDLGCGYGEFINQVHAGRKYAMDLNPDAPSYLSDDVEFIRQDCSQPWPVEEASLDVIFTSNFFEHLPDKAALGRTLDQAHKALRKGGRLIAMGPNAKLVRGAYWDFWDHHIPLTESSLSEALQHRGFRIALKRAAFLPYTMAGKRSVPTALIRLYLAIPWVWRFFGKQFLVVAVKDRSGPSRDATK